MLWSSIRSKYLVHLACRRVVDHQAGLQLAIAGDRPDSKDAARIGHGERTVLAGLREIEDLDRIPVRQRACRVNFVDPGAWVDACVEAVADRHHVLRLA